MNRTDRELALFYTLFALGAVATLLLPLEIPSGWRVLGLVLTHAVALPAFARFRGHTELTSVIRFVWPLSVAMLLPDWVLSAVFGTLHFPDDGAPRIDTMPVAMAFMWSIPLTLSTWIGRRRNSALAAATSALVIFLGSEIFAPTLGLWTPAGDVALVGGVAVYVLFPEWLLGFLTYEAWHQSLDAPWPRRLFDSFVVALSYLGALGIALLAVERLPGLL
ncbi:MAG: hypothetical protein AAF610_14385 [Pseudomonadota bacterium]